LILAPLALRLVAALLTAFWRRPWGLWLGDRRLRTLPLALLRYLTAFLTWGLGGR
jgi:hypothetical protein